MSSNTKTLTEGPLAKQILLVSLPLAFSNLLQVLFNMSDVAVVGRFAGSTALGAVGSTSILVSLFTGFLIGLSGGINVLVARFYGARHAGDVEKTVHSAAIVSLIAGVVCGGDVDAGTMVTEEYLMALERKAFCALIEHPKTQERILGMLNTGKPVRN